MERLKSFNEFINEDEFKIDDPSKAGTQLVNTISQNVPAHEVGNNSGAVVNKFQRSVGISDGQPWCMAFIYYIFEEFSKKLGITNPVYKTGSTLDEWEKTKGKKITAEQAKSNFSLVKPGQIMIAKREGGGHAGIVTSVDYNGKKYTTIEGNVGIGGGKQGVGSYNRSILVEGLIGFIDYFPDRSPEFDSSFISAMKGAKLTDASRNAVVRSLPGDDIIGGDSAASSAEEDKKNTSGGLLGKIVSGARKFTSIGRKEEDGGDDSISAKDAVEAFGRVTGK
jgi:hypothetical protein